MSVRLMRNCGGVIDKAELQDATVSDIRISPTNASAGIQLNADGNVYRVKSTGNVYLYPWRTGPFTADKYEAKFAPDPTYHLTTGSEDTWEALSSSRSYYVTETTNGDVSKQCIGTLYIRKAASPNTVLATAAMDFTAAVEL